MKVLIFLFTVLLVVSPLMAGVPDQGGLEQVDPRFVRVVKKQRGVKRGISYYKGQPVFVELQGNWFPAQIIGGGGERWHIRYNTEGNMPDEWVGRERLRPR